MPKEQVQQTLRRVKELFEQRSAYVEGSSMSEYTNPSPVENFIYYATHNGQGNITVESVGGDFDPKQLTDLDWWNVIKVVNAIILFMVLLFISPINSTS